MGITLIGITIILLALLRVTRVEIDNTKWRYSADRWTRTDNEDEKRVEEYDHNGWDGAWIPVVQMK